MPAGNPDSYENQLAKVTRRLVTTDGDTEVGLSTKWLQKMAAGEEVHHFVMDYDLTRLGFNYFLTNKNNIYAAEFYANEDIEHGSFKPKEGAIPVRRLEFDSMSRMRHHEVRKDFEIRDVLKDVDPYSASMEYKKRLLIKAIEKTGSGSKWVPVENTSNPRPLNTPSSTPPSTPPPSTPPSASTNPNRHPGSPVPRATSNNKPVPQNPTVKTPTVNRPAPRGSITETLEKAGRKKRPNRGTILVDIDSTLLGDVGDRVWNSLSGLDMENQVKTYRSLMKSDPKNSQIPGNKQLIRKLQKLKSAGYDLKLWTDRGDDLKQQTISNLAHEGQRLGIKGEKHPFELSVGKEKSLFSDLIMGSGEKLKNIPKGTVAVIDDRVHNIQASRSKRVIDMGVAEEGKPTIMAGITKKGMKATDEKGVKIKDDLQRFFGPKVLTQNKLKDIERREKEFKRVNETTPIQPRPESKPPTHSQTKTTPPKPTSKVVEPKIEKIKERVSKKANKKSTASAVEESIRQENKKRTKSKKKSGGTNRRKTTDAAKHIQENKNKKKVSRIKHGLEEDKRPKDAGRLDNSYDKKQNSRQQTLSVDDTNTIAIREASQRLKALEEQKKQEKQARVRIGERFKRTRPAPKKRRIPGPQTNKAPKVDLRDNPPERVAPPRNRAGTTSSNILRFYTDIEATGLSEQDVDVVSNKAGKKFISRQRGVSPQLIQLYGVFEGEPEGEINRHAYLDLGGDNPEARLASSKSIYNQLEIEFKPAGSDEYISNQKIAQIMASDGDESLELKNAMRSRKGEFRLSAIKDGETLRLTPSNAEALRGLMATNRQNVTPGMLPMPASVVGHTMNKILASNVFEAKFGRDNMKDTQGIISEVLVKLESKVDYAKTGHQIELVGWNSSYDVSMKAKAVERYGTSEDKKRFQRLFGKRINDGSAPIKVVDQADKMKDIEFALMVRDSEYTAVSINQRELQTALGRGESKADIRESIKRNIESNRTGDYLKRHGSIKNFANAIRMQADSPKSEAMLNDYFITELKKAPGRVGAVTSAEKNAVTALSHVVNEMATEIRSNPEKNTSATEYVRKLSRMAEGIERGKETITRIFHSQEKGSSTTSIFGYSRDSGITVGPDGPERSVLEFQRRRATGLDFMAGYSLGSGDGGLLNAFVTVAEDYGETVQSSQLRGVLDKVGNRRDPKTGTLASYLQGGLHDASVDVASMRGIIDMFDKGVGSPTGMDGATVEYFQKVQNMQLINSAETHLARHINAEDIDSNILRDAGAGSLIEGAAPGNDQLDIADVEHAGRKTLGDAAKENIPGLGKGIPSKRGTLVKAALITSGLVLIGNANGDIKNSGNKHNTLSGISPSGDPLLHSFGSGDDKFSNQSISALTNGLNFGSNTLRSSSLGYHGDRLTNMLLGFETFNDYSRSSERGEIAHKIIEQEYMNKGLAQSREHFIYSAELDVVGHVDLILNSGVPLEIKSVEDFDALQKLNAPKEHHVSQANFYAYALDQPYGLIGYAARNDPTKVKYFKVNTDINRVADDVRRVRGAAQNLRRQGHDVVTYSAHKYMSDKYLQMTQSKYHRAATNTAVSVGEGMLQSPEQYGGYSAITSLGDYSKHQKKHVWRQERKAGVVNTAKHKSKSRIRNQGKHADLHGNAALKYSQRQSGYHNRSRAMNYSGA